MSTITLTKLYIHVFISYVRSILSNIQLPVMLMNPVPNYFDGMLTPVLILYLKIQNLGKLLTYGCLDNSKLPDQSESEGQGYNSRQWFMKLDELPQRQSSQHPKTQFPSFSLHHMQITLQIPVILMYLKLPSNTSIWRQNSIFFIL